MKEQSQRLSRCVCRLRLMSGSPLRSRPLLALLTGEAVSSLGSQMTFLALPWFVLVTTGSAARMGIVLAAELVPVALLGIPSGAVIARYGARRTMMVADLCRAPVLAAVPFLHSLGMLDFWLLLVLVALVGVFIAPSFAAQRLVLPELVGRGRDRRRPGERRLRGSAPRDGPARPGRCRAADLGLRGAGSALRRRCLVRVRVRDALAVRAPAPAEGSDGREPRRAGRGSLHPRAITCWQRRGGHRARSSTCSRRCSWPLFRCWPTRTSTATRGSRGRSSQRSGSVPSSARSSPCVSCRASTRSASVRRPSRR